MRFVAGVAIAAVCCITLITCIALAFGHDNMLVTGATTAIGAIAAGVGMYFKGKSKGTSEAAAKKTDGQGQP